MNLALRLEIIAPGKAPDLLHARTDLPRSRIKHAMRCGAVWLERGGRRSRLRRASRVLQPGDILSIYYNQTLLESVPPSPTLICDRTDYSAWYKPAGLLCSGSRFGDHHTIGRWLEQHWARPSFIVHRLDRATRGVMLIAHGKSIADQLARGFRERRVRKCYQARVVGKLSQQQTLTTPIDGKAALSHISPIHSREDFTVVQVEIETGRKHQIRQHLAAIGHPVIGDALYGQRSSHGLQLVALSIEIECPIDGRYITYSIPTEERLY